MDLVSLLLTELELLIFLLFVQVVLQLLDLGLVSLPVTVEGVDVLELLLEISDSPDIHVLVLLGVIGHFCDFVRGVLLVLLKSFIDDPLFFLELLILLLELVDVLRVLTDSVVEDLDFELRFFSDLVVVLTEPFVLGFPIGIIQVKKLQKV